MKDFCVICDAQALSSHPGKALSLAMPRPRVLPEPQAYPTRQCLEIASGLLGSRMRTLKTLVHLYSEMMRDVCSSGFSYANLGDSGLDSTMAIAVLGHLPHTRTSCKCILCFSSAFRKSLVSLLLSCVPLLFLPPFPSLGLVCLSCCALYRMFCLLLLDHMGLRPSLEHRQNRFKVQVKAWTSTSLWGHGTGDPAPQRETGLGLEIDFYFMPR